MSDYFSKHAHQWDVSPRVKRAELIARKMIRLLSETRWEKALEFGCGTGLIGLRIKSIVEELTMIDTSDEMIIAAREKIKDLNDTNIQIFKHDLLKNDLNAESFDLIYASLSLHHVKNTKAALERFKYHLKSGGTLCLIELNPDDGTFHSEDPLFDGHNGFEQEYLKELLIDEGYTVFHCETFLHDIKKIKDKEHPFSLFIMVAQK